MNPGTVDPGNTTPSAGITTLLAGTDQPVLTYLDEATGERVDLSAAALGGWAARTAGLLRDGCGLGPGHRAAVLLPPHWQTAAVLLGTWAAGIAVSYRSEATAGLPALGPRQDEPLDVTFVAAHRVGAWLDHVPDAHHRFVLGLAPGGTPTHPVPEGYLDFLTEARRYPDDLPASTQVSHGDAATVDGTTYRQWGSLASAVAEKLDLHPGDKVLINVADHAEPVKWLLAPLAAGASMVVCANLDPARTAELATAEGVTRVL